jgi:hypothetical protein
MLNAICGKRKATTKVTLSYCSENITFFKKTLDKNLEFDILDIRDTTDCTPRGVDNSVVRRRRYLMVRRCSPSILSKAKGRVEGLITSP